MTVSVFFPASSPTAPVDGRTVRGVATALFTDHRAGAGDGFQDGDATGLAVGVGTNGTSLFETLKRAFFLFDTAPTIPDGDTIDSATFEVAAINILNDFAEGGSISMVATGASTPASTSVLASADHNIGNWPSPLVKQAPDKTVAGLTLLDPDGAYNSFALNGTGLGNIVQTGAAMTRFGLMLLWDFDNAGPTAAVNKTCHVRMAFAEEALVGEKRPRLTVTHTSPTTFIPRAMVF